MTSGRPRIRTAMVLAAGLGTRMRPLSDTCPKPLIEVGGKALIDHAFDRLRAHGVSRAVVNKHYLADQIDDWAGRQRSPAVMVSDETAELLDTGGGVARALPVLGTSPFLVLNSDSFWLDGPVPALDRMAAAFDPATMDCLALVAPKDRAVGFDGPGDFTINGEGRLARRGDGPVAPFIYAGCYVAAPDLFADAPPAAFSMNLLWDRAIAAGRMAGLEHDGLWLHVGTPDAIATAETAMRDYQSGSFP